MHKLATLSSAFLLITLALTANASRNCSDYIKHVAQYYQCQHTDKSSLLGYGSNGIAFLVTSTTSKQKFVLKVSQAHNPNSYAKLDSIYELLKNEKYIVKRYYSAIHEMELYEILEYGEMGSLYDNLPLMQLFKDQNKLLELFGHIVEGIAAMHKQGVIHADIKADNVVLMGPTEPRIIDFDVSLKKNAGASARGTRSYMAPEVLRQISMGLIMKYTEKQDIWSLGVLLYAMLYGKTPYYFERSRNPNGSRSKGLATHDEMVEFVNSGKIIVTAGTSKEIIDILEAMLQTEANNRKNLEDVHQMIDAALQKDELNYISADTHVLTNKGNFYIATKVVVEEPDNSANTIKTVAVAALILLLSLTVIVVSAVCGRQKAEQIRAQLAT